VTCDKTAAPNHLALSAGDDKNVATKLVAVLANTSAAVNIRISKYTSLDNSKCPTLNTA